MSRYGKLPLSLAALRSPWSVIILLPPRSKLGCNEGHFRYDPGLKRQYRASSCILVASLQQTVSRNANAGEAEAATPFSIFWTVLMQKRDRLISIFTAACMLW